MTLAEDGDGMAANTSGADAGADAGVGRAGLFGWLMFDWAAQPFFTVITTFIFGPYFVSQLGSDPVAGQTAWAHAATIAGLFIAVFAPLAGGLADAAGGNKRFIGILAVLQIASLAMLWFAAPGTGYFWPALFIIAATIAAEISVVFNDAMLPHLVRPGALNRTSNDAWGLGYLGGMIFLIAVILLLSADPDTGLTILGHKPLFGLDPATGEAARITGPLSALWYLVFLLPLFLLTPDLPRRKPVSRAISEGLADLKETVVGLRGRPVLSRFFIARMIYMDGVNGLLILGGAFAAAMFGWSTMEIGLYGIILHVTAIFGCFAAARLSHRIRPGATIAIALSMLVVATVGFASTTKSATLFGLIALPPGSEGLFSSGAEKAFILFGLLIGLAFGPVQAASRAYLGERVSREETGRLFGLFSLTGRLTSFMATATFALLTGWTGSPNIGMASLLLFLVIGLVLFLPALGRRD